MNKLRFNLHLTPHTNINSKQMKDINVKNKTLRIKHGRKFLLPWVKQQVYSLDTKNHNPLKKSIINLASSN